MAPPSSLRPQGFGVSGPAAAGMEAQSRVPCPSSPQGTRWHGVLSQRAGSWEMAHEDASCGLQLPPRESCSVTVSWGFRAKTEKCLASDFCWVSPCSRQHAASSPASLRRFGRLLSGSLFSGHSPDFRASVSAWPVGQGAASGSVCCAGWGKGSPHSSMSLQSCGLAICWWLIPG